MAARSCHVLPCWSRRCGCQIDPPNVAARRISLRAIAAARLKSKRLSAAAAKAESEAADEERKTTSHTLCALLADEGGHSAFQHGDGLCRLGHTRGQARPGNGEKVFVSTTPGSVFLF